MPIAIVRKSIPSGRGNLTQRRTEVAVTDGNIIAEHPTIAQAANANVELMLVIQRSKSPVTAADNTRVATWLRKIRRSLATSAALAIPSNDESDDDVVFGFMSVSNLESYVRRTGRLVVTAHR